MQSNSQKNTGLALGLRLADLRRSGKRMVFGSQAWVPDPARPLSSSGLERASPGPLGASVCSSVKWGHRCVRPHSCAARIKCTCGAAQSMLLSLLKEPPGWGQGAGGPWYRFQMLQPKRGYVWSKPSSQWLADCALAALEGTRCSFPRCFLEGENEVQPPSLFPCPINHSDSGLFYFYSAHGFGSCW